MTAVVYMVDCASCVQLQPVEAIRVNDEGGQWRCAVCGTAFGWWADLGEVVLDEIRAVTDGPGSFDVFADPMPPTARITWDHPWR